MTDIARIAPLPRARGQRRRTPLLSSPVLDRIAGRRVLVKAECLQHTGSLQVSRRQAALTRRWTGRARRGVLAYSSGNHAQGVALAPREARRRPR